MIQPKELKKFLQESNLIEGISDKDSLNQALYAWKFLIKEDKLTVSNILKAHKILMLHQPIYPDQKGYFRKVPVWVGVREGASWYAIPELMAQWVLNANDIVVNGKNESNIFLERIIKEQHVKFETIHPFIDGNGRLGRLLMNWQRVKLNKELLVIEDSKKRNYYKWFN